MPVYPIGSNLLRGSYLDEVEVDFSQPGKPVDNAFIEAFHSRFL